MARIYQNEKVLMKEVGLIADFKLAVHSTEVINFEGTTKEALALGYKLAEKPNVIHVEVFKRK